VLISTVGSSAQETICPNPFVETTISYVLSYISALVSSPIESASITILADDDYYTQPNSDNITEFKGQHFKDFGVSLADAHKTGLGSSAALVTALTAALLSHYLTQDLFSMQTEEGKARLHNLAQTAHCAAQGKVGSGFDVASAVYGPCVYRRFSPTLLQRHGSPGSAQFASRLKTLVGDSDPSNRWDTEVAKSAVKVPRGIRLVMCDVDCGSQTPGMVKQLLAWRAKEPEEAAMLWRQLHSKNQALAAELKRLAEAGGGQSEDEYDGLSRCFADIRVLIRDMSRLSGVPVEPEEQTKLLDACSAVEGVIGGVVPGAGGFDAIALLVRDEKEAFDNLRGRLEEWNQTQSQTWAVGRVSLLRVREEMEGVRSEDAASKSSYGSWLG
jgi:phosphomevalonate kinase